MSEEADSDGALLRLLSWLSPAFPVGAFAYSHGLERAIEDGRVRDRDDLLAWLTDLIEQGSGWNDAVLLAESWRTREADDARRLLELAAAMAGSRERHLETTLQGGAFADAIAVWARASTAGSERGEVAARTEPAGAVAPYPVAVGAAARRHDVPLRPALLAFLHAFASNLVGAAVRLVPLGQRDGVATMAGLEPTLRATAIRAARSTLDDLGSCTMMSEIMSMVHETQYSRVFRS